MSEEYKPLYRHFFPKDLIDLINKKNISKTVIIYPSYKEKIISKKLIL